MYKARFKQTNKQEAWPYAEQVQSASGESTLPPSSEAVIMDISQLCHVVTSKNASSDLVPFWVFPYLNNSNHAVEGGV